MKTVASFVSITFTCALGACGAVSDSTTGDVDLRAENLCYEPAPPIDNTAELAPDAAQGGGS